MDAHFGSWVWPLSRDYSLASNPSTQLWGIFILSPEKQFGLAQFRQNTEPQLDSQKTQIFLSLRLHGAVVTKEIQKQKFEKFLSQMH